MADQGPSSELLRELVDQFERPRYFTSYYQAPRGPLEQAEPYSVLDALGLEKGDLSNTASAALEAIEESVQDSPSDWLDLRWKLSAFLHLQDVFDAVLQELKEDRVLFQQYYFYYESRVLLAECMLAGLNGLYMASDALLRPFLEFSLLQNYYYRVMRGSGSYAAIEKFFSDGQSVSWGTALKRALPKDDFCRPIRFRVHSHLTALSQSVQHPYHPDESVQ